MTQNCSLHTQKKQKTSAFIAVLYLKVTVRPLTESKHSSLTAIDLFNILSCLFFSLHEHTLDQIFIYQDTEHQGNHGYYLIQSF